MQTKARFFLPLTLLLMSCAAPAPIETSADQNQSLKSRLNVERPMGFEAFIALTAEHASITWTQTLDGEISYQHAEPSPIYLALAVRTPIKHNIGAILDPLHENVKALLAAHDVPAQVTLSPVMTAGERASFFPTPPFRPLMESIQERENRAAFRALTNAETAGLDAIPEGWIVVLTGGEWPGRLPRFSPPDIALQHIRQILQAASDSCSAQQQAKGAGAENKGVRACPTN